MLKIFKLQSIQFNSITLRHRKSLILSSVISIIASFYDFNLKDFSFLGITLNPTQEIFAVPFFILLIVTAYFLVHWIIHLNADIYNTKAAEAKNKLDYEFQKAREWRNFSTEERNKLEGIEAKEVSSKSEAIPANQVLYLTEVYIPVSLALAAFTFLVFRICI